MESWKAVHKYSIFGYDGIEYRGFGQDIVEELARYAGVPVWNGLTNEYHPTQMLAATSNEQRVRVLVFSNIRAIFLPWYLLTGTPFFFLYARYNMGNSLMVACSKMGLHFTACTSMFFQISGQYFCPGIY